MDPLHRDAWTTDRGSIQPLRLVGGFTEWLADMNEASAAATDLHDVCLRMEDAGALVRLDPDVEPSFWRNPILSATERATLGSIGHVVRMGRVRRVGAAVIELEQGSTSTIMALVRPFPSRVLKLSATLESWSVPTLEK